MRIFLTGEKQIGKSTVLRRTVELLGAVPGGFYTRYWETEAGRSLRLCTPWAQDSTVQDEVACWENGRPVPRVERFDALGARRVRSCPEADFLIMDELGFLEADAVEFRRAVLDTLDGERPVLGVIRKGLPGWTADVARHPGVELITVTEENRDALPAQLAARLHPLLTPKRLGAVVMASGHATRFGSNKLLAQVAGAPMLAQVLSHLPNGIFRRVAVVARDETALLLAREFGCTPVFNDDCTNDTACTIRLGLAQLPEELDGVMFLVGDQPWLTAKTIKNLAAQFHAQPESIHALCYNGVRGNPVIFPCALRQELMALPPHATGRQVLAAHPELLCTMDAAGAEELQDVDYPSDLVPKTSSKCRATDSSTSASSLA